jgi:hypothetical protein
MNGPKLVVLDGGLGLSDWEAWTRSVDEDGLLVLEVATRRWGYAEVH